MLRAVRGLDVIVKVIGEGELRDDLIRLAREMGVTAEFTGYLGGNALHEMIRRSLCVVVPSICYENQPLSVLESFALGKPVVASRIGGLPELVRDGETGITFKPGDAEDLRAKLQMLLQKPELVAFLGHRARRVVEEEFSPDRHYSDLMKIYAMAGDSKRLLDSKDLSGETADSARVVSPGTVVAGNDL